MTDPPHCRARQTFSLVELVVVMLLLAATAGVVVVLIGDSRSKAEGHAVKASVLALQAAVYGAGGVPGYYQDLGELPQSLNDLFQKPGAAADYDPQARRGWNGPYLDTRGTLVFNQADQQLSNRLQTAGFTIGSSGDLADGSRLLLDPYGLPYLLERPTSTEVRIRSAGPDRRIRTADDHEELLQ